MLQPHCEGSFVIPSEEKHCDMPPAHSTNVSEQRSAVGCIVGPAVGVGVGFAVGFGVGFAVGLLEAGGNDGASKSDGIIALVGDEIGPP